MTAMVSKTSNSFNCCSMAAVTSSARMVLVMDTAIALAVSICICVLALLRIIEPGT